MLGTRRGWQAFQRVIFTLTTETTEITETNS